jgi:putative DNA-invertase from lambdoid prophage Rac
MPQIYSYLRVSTNHQVESESVRSQVDAVFAFAQKNNICEQSIIFVRDEGVSGKTPIADRPGLRELLYSVKKGDTLIVSSLCRLSRDLMTSLLIEEELNQKKVKLISTKDEGTASDDPASELLKRIIQSFSSYERSLIATRTKAALQARKRRGLVWNGTTPFGFRAGTKNSKKLVIEDREVEVLFAIDELRGGLEKRTYKDVALQLNASGYTNRSGGAWTLHQARKVWMNWNDFGRDLFFTLQNSGRA